MSALPAVEHKERVRRTAILAVSMGLILLLALANRKLGFHGLDSRAVDVLRWRDIFTLFVLSPAAMLVSWEIFKLNGGGASRLLSWTFISGVFLLGIGFGMHEPANAMNIASYGSIPKVGPSLDFFDDKLGHWAFFAGFMMVLLSLVASELRSPFERAIPKWGIGVSVGTGLAMAVSIFGNMVGERPKVGLDMLVLLASLLLAFAANFMYGFVRLSRAPLALCLYVGLGLGCLSTFLSWAFR